MRYPIEEASSIPCSGNAFFIYLLDNLSVPAKATHDIWYYGCKKLVDDKQHPFQGFFPIGKTLSLSYGGKEISNYTFTGKEKNSVFVQDLSNEAMFKLGISADANKQAKVFNPKFRVYEELTEDVRKDNELPALSLAKSIASFLSSKDVLYTEDDIVNMLRSAVIDLNSQEMRHILHGNHLTWCAARFMECGLIEQDIKKNFYGVNDIDFYIKDVGTIMPAILYSLALLGHDPEEIIEEKNYDLWGIEETAKAMQIYMYCNVIKEAC